MLEAGELSEGHGRAVLQARDRMTQRRLAAEARDRGCRCAEAEALARRAARTSARRAAARGRLRQTPTRSARRRGGAGRRARARSGACRRAPAAVEIPFERPRRGASARARLCAATSRLRAATRLREARAGAHGRLSVGQSASLIRRRSLVRVQDRPCAPAPQFAGLLVARRRTPTGPAIGSASERRLGTGTVPIISRMADAAVRGSRCRRWSSTASASTWSGKQPIVLLKTIDGNKFLPIWIGHPEAAAILMKLQGATTPRPMTHDLISEMIGELDAQCTRVCGDRAARTTPSTPRSRCGSTARRSRSTRAPRMRSRWRCGPRRRSSPPRK